MSLYLIPHFILRAPLLPVRDLRRPSAALQRHPLGAMAVDLASPDLAVALQRKPGLEAAAAFSRYARRAAFRPTPSGLLAGVAMGRLGAATRIATDEGEAHLAPTWERMASLGRALLDQPEVRPFVRLRIAPSLMAAGDEAVWLGFDRDGLEVRFGSLDDVLRVTIEQAQEWAGWSQVSQALQGAATGDADAVDELVLVLIDRGVLCHDLAPPLVGPPAGIWMAQRLTEFPAELEEWIAPIRQGLAPIASTDLATTRARLASLPGAQASATDVMGMLSHCPQSEPVLSRRAVERAAACAPLLFRLQEALAGPVAERVCDAGLVEQLEAVVEVFGAGALDVSALALGGYGHALAESDEETAPRMHSEVLAYLVETMAQAAAGGEREIQLDPVVLDTIVPEDETPPTFELFLSPASEPARKPPGTGWLLGLHAPAGASWGRFADVLGAPMREALAELAAAEMQVRPGEAALDVVYAPSPALADLCRHPPVRQAALALCGWPAGMAVTPAQLELVVDPSAAEPWALRASQPVAPSPLHRVRSTTAPPGIYRLLAGWAFARQHAPWALTWGPLAGLSFLPRVRLDGFVVAPASWRVPAASEIAQPDALARWRRQYKVPAAVQAGEGDELLYLDLRAPDAARELARFAGGRVFEIWPPLSELPDQGGRRVETVVAVVSDGTGAQGRAIEATHQADRVEPPCQAAAAKDWASFRLYGAVEKQSAVLFEAVAPTVRAALSAGEIDTWFFLPYMDQPGRRHHLRVRAHARSASKAAAFDRRLRRALAPLCSRGDVVDVVTAGYFREAARYGGKTLMPAVEQLFAASSELVLAVLRAEDQGTGETDRVTLVVRAADALTGGLGLDLPARQALAQRCRDASAAAGLLDDETARQAYRQRSRQLYAWVAGVQKDVLTPALRKLHKTAVAVAGFLDADLRPILKSKLPALLHMQAVRLVGADSSSEALAIYLWHRVLESIQARSEP
jgi:thiopeptide-type bacteriocin biosynthesis protein